MKTPLVKISLVSVFVVGGLIAIGAAQQGAPVEVRQILTQAGSMTRVALETRVTKGAPYSAEAVTEFVQQLPDGNRIVRRTTSRLYRDSDGRTRRELVSAIPEGSENPGVVITDPVAGVNLMLDPEARTVQRSPAMWAKVTSAGAVAAGGRGGGRGGGAQLEVFTLGDAAKVDAAKREAETALRLELSRKLAELNGAVTTTVRERAGGGTASKEDLGQQVIEGVTANGTRTTTVVPAGAIGNELPLTTVSEQWFSTELEVLVLTRHSDPRVGETTYKLTNIQRAEPDRSLFQAPADYTVKENMRRPQ